MRATVVVDNIGTDAMPGEWGLCVYIEYGDKVILLDAGASALFQENAQKLGLDLGRVDCGVLSHAHYDHANGIPAFFHCNSHAKFYLRQGCAPDCYDGPWLFKFYIGIPRDLLQEYAGRIELVSGDRELYPGVWLVPHKTPDLAHLGRREMMYRKMGRRWRPDDFDHEQSLVFHTPEGLVIFNSCSHGGVDNIIREVADTFPDQPVRALIGGFHLYNKSPDEVRAFARRVKATGIQKLYTGHCTGKKALRLLQEELGEVVEPFSVGLVMEF